MLFFIWNIALNVLRRDSIVTYVQEIFTGKSILKFLALNESPLAGHLWYLGAKDKSALLSSSSGGAFTALSDFFLENGNAVVAAIYNYENHTAEFQLILNKNQREKAKGSKYMQSKPGDIYREAYHWLMENPKKELLFVGMGCQSDGFRGYTKK